MVTGADRERLVIDAFIGFADRLVDEFDVLDLTIQLTEDCARLFDVASAGFLLADAAGVLHVLATSNERAAELELLQLQRDEGPCLDCFHSGRPVQVTDVQAEATRWPKFVAAAAENGLLSAFALPMRLRGEALGVLGLFRKTTGELAESDLRLAQALVHVASIALAQQDRNNTQRSMLATVQATVLSRGLLEMAKGVLAEVHALSMDEAAHRLRSYARQHGQRLIDVSRTAITIDDPARRSLLTDIGAMQTSATKTNQ